MNIEATKLEIMHLLLQTQKESILAKIKKVFDNEKIDWWNDMSAEEQEEVDKGLSQADKEEYISDKNVMKNFDKWH